MAKKKTIVIVDGHAMAYRAHFAMAPQGLTNTSGMPTGAIFGFYRMILKLLADTRPDYFLLVFDPPGKSFRSEVYKDYKANRSKMPDELRAQLDEIKLIAEALKLPMYIPEGVEADDALASFAEQHKDENLQVMLVSGDKDLFNVLHKNVVLYRPKKGVSEFITIDKKYVKEKLGLSTEQIPDYMALMGDSSDNIPGVKGIGEKTATKLIIEFKSLEKLYKNIEKVTPKGVQSKLVNGEEEARLSYELVTLKKDMKLPFKLADLEFASLKNLGEDINVFKEKDFAGLYNDWVKFLGSTPKKAEQVKGIAENRQIVLTKEAWQQLLPRLQKAEYLAVDCETTSSRPMQAELVGLALSWREGEEFFSAYVPVVFDRQHEQHLDYQEVQPPEECLGWLKPLLEDKKLPKVAQNIKYDQLVLENHGVKVQNLAYDSMVMSYMLNPNQRRHGLDELANNLLGHEMISYKELVGVGKKQKALVELPIEQLAHYAAEDAEVCLRIFYHLLDNFEKTGNSKLYDKIDKPLIFTLMNIERQGILLDTDYLQTLEKEYQKKVTKAEKEIYKHADEEFNIQSTKELQRILFDKLQIESTKKTAKGALSTEHKVLVSLKHRHKIIPPLLDHRTYTKLMSTYVTPLPTYINPQTGRVHTSLSQVTAATGRLASTEPNLQNIPIKGEDGRLIRKAFIAAPGHSMLTLDYSQIELRLLAHYSQDENLVRAYREEADIHDQAVYLLFHHQFDPQKKKWRDDINLEGQLSYDIDQNLLDAMKATPQYTQKRSQAKVLNFSIAYGVTEWGLSQNLGITPKEAKQLIDLYFLSFPGIRKYMHDIVEQTRKTGYSTNLFGRKRRITELTAKNRFAREAAERLAINNPIQSTAADIIKLAMIEIDKQLKKFKSKLLLQVHDELVLEVVEEEKEQIFAMVKDKMENVVKLSVPLVVGGGFAHNWEEAK